MKGGENVIIEIGITDVRGNRHEITLEAETTHDYCVCKELMREVWRQGIIKNYVVALVKER